MPRLHAAIFARMPLSCDQRRKAAFDRPTDTNRPRFHCDSRKMIKVFRVPRVRSDFCLDNCNSGVANADSIVTIERCTTRHGVQHFGLGPISTHPGSAEVGICSLDVHGRLNVCPLSAGNGYNRSKGELDNDLDDARDADPILGHSSGGPGRADWDVDPMCPGGVWGRSLPAL
jgi:hypothetical protein